MTSTLFHKFNFFAKVFFCRVASTEKAKWYRKIHELTNFGRSGATSGQWLGIVSAAYEKNWLI